MNDITINDKSKNFSDIFEDLQNNIENLDNISLKCITTEKWLEQLGKKTIS